MTDSDRFDNIDASIRANFRRDAEIIANYEVNDDPDDMDMLEVEAARKAIAEYDSQFPGMAQEFERLVEQIKSERVKQESEVLSSEDKSDEEEQSERTDNPSDDDFEVKANEAWVRDHFLFACEHLADYEIRIQAGEELSDDEKRHFEELKESIQEFMRRFPEEAVFLQKLLEDARRWIQEERIENGIQQGPVFPRRITYGSYGKSTRSHSRPAGWDTGQRTPIDLEAYWAEKNRKKQLGSGNTPKVWQEPGIPKESLFNDYLTSDWAAKRTTDQKDGMTEEEATLEEYNAFRAFMEESSVAFNLKDTSKFAPPDENQSRNENFHYSDEASDYLSTYFSDMLPDPSQPLICPVDELNDEDGFPFQ